MDDPTEEKIDLILMSYGLLDLLERNDIEEAHVVSLLVEQGLIDMERYFPNDN